MMERGEGRARGGVGMGGENILVSACVQCEDNATRLNWIILLVFY